MIEERLKGNGKIMIKLKDILTEFYNDPIFGSDTTHWTVVKPFKFQTRKGWKASGMHYGSSKIYKGDYEWVVAPKGAQVSNIPGGLFVIIDKKKQAFHMKQRGHKATKRHIEPRDSKITDWTLWKNRKPIKDMK